MDGTCPHAISPRLWILQSSALVYECQFVGKQKDLA